MMKARDGSTINSKLISIDDKGESTEKFTNVIADTKIY